MKLEPNTDILQTGDAARLCGVSSTTIHLWERIGKLPALRTASGVRLFRRCDVEQLASERQHLTEVSA